MRPIAQSVATAQLQYVTDNKDMRRFRKLRPKPGPPFMSKFMENLIARRINMS